jgi:DNA anti-recombination protein RmuC
MAEADRIAQHVAERWDVVQWVASWASTVLLPLLAWSWKRLEAAVRRFKAQELQLTRTTRSMARLLERIEKVDRERNECEERHARSSERLSDEVSELRKDIGDMNGNVGRVLGMLEGRK